MCFLQSWLYCLFFVLETSDAGTPAGGGAPTEDARSEHRDPTADGSPLCRERTPHEGSRNPQRNYQGKLIDIVLFDIGTSVLFNVELVIGLLQTSLTV